ncbi:MAG: hypothetical protein HQK67_13035 [Desulfamplus sp.]|nr:hypothetical protein [Desulfamplus sp.]
MVTLQKVKYFGLQKKELEKQNIELELQKKELENLMVDFQKNADKEQETLRKENAVLSQMLEESIEIAEKIFKRKKKS